MTTLNLNRGQVSDFGAGVRGRISNAYEQLAGTDDYKKNNLYLKVIQICTVTLSAAATGYVNAFAHLERLGIALSVVLAVLVTGFVEAFFFCLRHGLTTVYKSGAQRFFAQFWYRVLMGTMVLNVALLGLWIFAIEPPPWLLVYNHYSLAIHFCAALVGVTAVRDSDSVVANRILELRASTGRQDLVTARKSAAVGSPLALLAANVRGFFDAVALSFRLLFSGGGFSKKFMQELAQVEAEQYGYLEALPTGRTTTAPVPRRPGFVNQGAPPKSPARWI